MKTITCTECNGSGIFDRIDFWAIDCPVCQGQGMVNVPTTDEEFDALGITSSAEDIDRILEELQDGPDGNEGQSIP